MTNPTQWTRPLISVECVPKEYTRAWVEPKPVYWVATALYDDVVVGCQEGQTEAKALMALAFELLTDIASYEWYGTSYQ